jgi:hypothetical protein
MLGGMDSDSCFIWREEMNVIEKKIRLSNGFLVFTNSNVIYCNLEFRRNVSRYIQIFVFQSFRPHRSENDRSAIFSTLSPVKDVTKYDEM